MQLISIYIRSLGLRRTCMNAFLKVMKKNILLNYFNIYDVLLWSISIITIVVSFVLFDKTNYVSLIGSLVGVNSLILCAKGNPIGEMLMIIFCFIYGYISYTFSYYGEMITYLCMTLPMTILALISWIRHPFKGDKNEVEVNHITSKEWGLMSLLTIIVTIIFYFILKTFNTPNLFLSTLSITTTFAAVYLTFRRTSYFSLAYALNDLVLIILWILANNQSKEYLSVIICFIVFFFNDSYGFLLWNIRERKQKRIMK